MPVFVTARLVVEDRGHRQAVPLPGLVVVVVVGGRDLDRAGAERRVDHGVGDHRHVAFDERDPDAATDERRVPRVVGVHGDGGVAEDRLGAGRGHRQGGVRVRLAGRLVEEVIAHGPQRPGLGRREHLEVADARLAARAPVDERLRAVRQALLVQPEERLAHGPRGDLVHREPQPAPVAAAADASLLVEDDRPGGVDELAHPLEIAVAAEAGAALALLRQDAVEDELGGDARVVESGQEQRRVAAHPRVADHQVLDRRPLGVAEVEAAGHVGRRLDDHERRQRLVRGRAGTIGREHVGREPLLVDGVLELGGDIGARESLGLGCAGVGLRLRHLFGSRRRKRPVVQRTNGVVVPPAGSTPVPAAHRGRPCSGILAARYRAPSARLASDLRVRRARAARTVPRSLRGRPGPTLLGRRREARSLPRCFSWSPIRRSRSGTGWGRDG